MEGTTFIAQNIKIKKLIIVLGKQKKLKYLAKRIEFTNNSLF
jgi:hypothetical protein